MFCRKYKILQSARDNAGGKFVIDAELVSTDTPDPLPTDGTGIDNFFEPADKVKFAPGSVLYIVNGGDVYVADEDGEFVKQ